MAKIKVKISLKNLKGFTKKEIASRKFQNKLGDRVLDMVKDSIAIGKSPVKGQGRYVAYHAARVHGSALNILKKDKRAAGFHKRDGIRDEIDREVGRIKVAQAKLYPNSVKDKYPSKKNRPINLWLSGDLMNALKWRRSLGGVTIGLIRASRKLKAIFRSHNEGIRNPRRAILPTGQKQQFTALIKRSIKNLYLARIRQMISINNKRNR